MIARIKAWMSGIPVKPTEVRSPQWPAVERLHLRLEAVCQVCGTKKDLDVHHLIPFSWDASKELDTDNLITLCRTHHFLVGHLTDWKSYNPQCEPDCEIWRRKIGHRPRK